MDTIEISRMGLHPESQFSINEELNAIGSNCKMIGDALYEILDDYKEKFDKNSETPIELYIELFDKYYSQLESFVFDENYILNMKNSTSTENFWKREKRFELFRYIDKNLMNKNNFILGEKNNWIGVKGKSFIVANKILKNIYVLERIVGNTTKKIWQETVTKVEDYKEGKKFGFFAQVISQDDWRKDPKNDFTQNFYKNKATICVSYISDQSIAYFSSGYKRVIAGYLYDEPNFLICGNVYDALSSEQIRGRFLPSDINGFHYNENLLAKFKENGLLHKVYGEATYLITPKALERNTYSYNELLLYKKIPNTQNFLTPKAVFYANESSYDYACQLAKNKNLPIIKIEEKVMIF